MDLSLSEDQRTVQQLFARFFQRESPPALVRKAEERGFDEDLWRAALASDLPTMAVSESRGGAGASMIDLVLVVREMGRHLAPIPLVEVLVASRLLSEGSGSDGLIEEITSGSLIPTIALRAADSDTARLVPAGSVADLAIVLQGRRLLAVRRNGPAEARTPALNLGSMPVADWALSGPDVTVTLLAEGADAARLHDRALTEWKLLTAAALSGLQAQAQQIGVDYTKGRNVFGAPLAWFQAVQHRLADIATEGVGAELLVLEAAWSHEYDPDRVAVLADMAFLFCSDVAFRTARESLQFHGGYGYTLEYDIQLYLRRAKAWPLVLGPSRRLYESLAQRLFAAPAGDQGAA